MDECVFTKETIQKFDYAPKYMNQTVDERDYYAPYIAVIAAISADKGVDLIMMFDKAVSRFEFIDFLRELRN